MAYVKHNEKKLCVIISVHHHNKPIGMFAAYVYKMYGVMNVWDQNIALTCGSAEQREPQHKFSL